MYISEKDTTSPGGGNDDVCVEPSTADGWYKHSRVCYTRTRMITERDRLLVRVFLLVCENRRSREQARTILWHSHRSTRPGLALGKCGTFFFLLTPGPRSTLGPQALHVISINNKFAQGQWGEVFRVVGTHCSPRNKIDDRRKKS